VALIVLVPLFGLLAVVLIQAEVPAARSDDFSRRLWAPQTTGRGGPRFGEVVTTNLESRARSDDFSRQTTGRGGPQTTEVVTTSGQLTPPATIRVYHTHYPPIGTIEVVDFETYVKRVVPCEMPASWTPEALKAQAVAARTYGWWKVLTAGSNPWDVTDWTDTQVCCPDDRRDPRTDAAADATRGQYAAYNGQIILAMYCADGSDPTLPFPSYLNPSPNTPYLQAIDDPVSFGVRRRGHGHGFSQWGGYRWSTRYAWNYQQILTHYYFSTTVEAPARASPDITAPIGSLVWPWSGWYVTGNRTVLTANASDEASGVGQVAFSAAYLDGAGSPVSATLGLATRGSDGTWRLPWDLSALPDQALTGTITVSAVISDLAGHATSVGGWRLGLDRQVPTGTLTISATANSPTVTLQLSATDSGASGLVGVGFSHNWLWEGEDLRHKTNSGQVVSDTEALNGLAWQGRAGTDQAGCWFGPYTYALPPGQPYRAYFRLKTSDAITTAEVAYLDVVDNGGAQVFGLRRLRGLDFRQAGVYQEIGVDLNYTATGTMGLEFRTFWRGNADLWLDRVLVTTYPITYTSSVTWTLAGGGPQTIYAKFVDGAGNVSPDATAVLHLPYRLYLPLILKRR